MKDTDELIATYGHFFALFNIYANTDAPGMRAFDREKDHNRPISEEDMPKEFLIREYIGTSRFNRHITQGVLAPIYNKHVFVSLDAAKQEVHSLNKDLKKPLEIQTEILPGQMAFPHIFKSGDTLYGVPVDIHGSSLKIIEAPVSQALLYPNNGNEAFELEPVSDEPIARLFPVFSTTVRDHFAAWEQNNEHRASVLWSLTQDEAHAKARALAQKTFENIKAFLPKGLLPA